MLSLRELVEEMVYSIVDDIESVQIVERPVDNGLFFEITVGKNDVGKLIGKEGRVAKAIRTIAKASGAKRSQRVLINVINKPLE